MTAVASFGMIGASKIGAEALIEPVRRRGDARVVLVAAKRQGAADAYAAGWLVPQASAAYEDVLTHDDVTAVYISNAAADHAHWALAALRAGKHVLCEKPIAVNAEQALAIGAAAASSGLVVMEGFHYRFHPLFRYLQALVTSGRFGVLRSIESVIAGTREYDPASILHVAGLGGGALLHNGVYGVHWSRLLFDAEPSGVRASQRLNPSGADSETIAELDFPGARTARVDCSFDRDAPVSVALHFDRAEVVATGVIGAHHGHSLRITPTGGASDVRTLAGRSSFDYQLDEFVQRCAGVARADERGDGIVANARVIDAIRQAAWPPPTSPLGPCR